MNEVLKLEEICKSFNGVKALDKVNLSIKKGEVHGLMGENGAGKSTLMKILAGIYTPDSGNIFLKGHKVKLTNPKESINFGIAMIHQELTPINEMTVAENIFLQREPTYKYSGVLNRRRLNMMTSELLINIGINIDPKAKMKFLSVAETQLIEIAKAVSYNSEILIMDEPTSAITELEVSNLFRLISRLTKKGVSIIYISHKMDEILKITDTITVLRDGNYIGSKNTTDINNDELITMMVGRKLNQIFPEINSEIKEKVLEVKELTKEKLFHKVSFDLKKGEILGIAGLMGAGRTELVESLFGIRRADSGEIFIKGQRVEINNPMDAIKHGLALVPEDRKKAGLNLKGSLKDNITLPSLDDYCHLGVINKFSENEIVDRQISSLNIKTQSRYQIVSAFSGGNQQKVVFSKWLLTKPEILILDEPTRGIDVGAKFEIYSIISKLASNGTAIIIISSELPEIIGMSHRVLVLCKGRITGEFTKDEISQEKIMACAT